MATRNRFFPDETVGEVAVRWPSAAKVFERLGVEICCGGGLTLGEIAASRHMSFERLAREIEDVSEWPQPPRPRWDRRPVAELTEHLVEAFHDPLRQELPRLVRSADRLRAHGGPHRRALAVVYSELLRLAGEIAAQMTIDESELFPIVRRLEAGAAQANDRARLEVLLSDARARQEDTGQTLRILRQVTDGYTPPPATCGSLAAFYRALQDFDALVRFRVHLETNVLFTRAAVLMSAAFQEKDR